MPHDGLRRELVRGVLFTMNPSNRVHGAVVGEITWPLGKHIRQHDLGTLFGAGTGFLLERNPDTVRAPDVAFVRKERIEQTAKSGPFFAGPPDLAVEVLSPGDRATEVNRKTADWLRHGAQVVWVVDPERATVCVHRLEDRPQVLSAPDTLREADLLPGFEVRVDAFFVTR